MNYFTVVLTVLSGLLVFLFAMTRLSEGLKEVAGGSMKKILDRFTSNLFTGIITGTVVTTILDSSSAVIIMTIALVSSRNITFKQAMGIVMGANIGTTIGSEIIAYDIGEWAALPMLIGLIMEWVLKNERYKAAGKVIFSIGLLFFGLTVIGYGVEPLKGSETFYSWMTHLENPLKGLFAGGITTLVIQSSSATVAMAIKLGSQDLLTLPAGIAVMMGAELGTCSDTLIATIGQSRQAIKTGIFHLVFNILSILLGYLLFAPFTELVEYLSAGASLHRTIANAHVLFNVSGVVIFTPFVPLMERLLNRLFPEKNADQPVTD